MKRDMALVRQVLLQTEQSANVTDLIDLNIEGYSPEESFVELFPVREIEKLRIETLNTQTISKREENIMKYVNSFYKSLLLLSLAVMPSAALAVEPVIDGTKTVTDVALGTVYPTWTVLTTTTVSIPAGSLFHCEVTCTSTVNNPYNITGDQDYYYAAYNIVNPTVADGCVRQFDFPKFDIFNDNDESDKLVVASTCFLPSLANTHTFRCLGTKLSVTDFPAVVDSTSMHVICVDDQG
jgi:hypothetical protein